MPRPSIRAGRPGHPSRPQRPGRSSRPRWWPLALLAALALAALSAVSVGPTQLGANQIGGGPSLSDTVDGAVAGNRFSLLDFEVQSVFNRWLGRVGDFVQGRGGAGDDADLQRFFDLRAEIDARTAAGAAPPAPGAPLAEEAAALSAERAGLRNSAERILEDRVGDAFRQAGFSRPLPLFDAQDILWPPVDVELTQPPRVLTVSPRAEIRIARSVLLDPHLTPAEIAAMEASIEAGGRWSAHVETIGGVGAYPAIVRDARSYPATVDTIAHEWTHNYLFFYPLGFHFFDGEDLRTINETVANMVGAEIAAGVLARFPALPPRGLPALDRTESDALLFQLRRDVDALLAQGRINDAEALMEEVRLQLVALGRNFRRINQAFFAANGVYADTPASSSPIGPLLRQLRDGSPTLLDFVAAVRQVDSLAELEDLADAPGGP